MNWVYYTITKKWTGGVSTTGVKFCKFGLSDSIVFKDGLSFNIGFSEGGYNVLEVGDIVQIDTGRLRFRGMNEIFSPSEAHLYFVRSHWQGKCQQMSADNKAVEKDRDELKSTLGKKIDYWKNLYVETKSELEKEKKKNQDIYNQLSTAKDERLKDALKHFGDMSKQQGNEAELRVKQARNEEIIKNLEKQEKEITERLKDNEKKNNVFEKLLEKTRFDHQQAQKTNILLLEDKAGSADEELDALASKFEISLVLVNEIKQLNEDLAEAVENGEREVVKKCKKEIAAEKQKLLDKPLSKDHVQEIFKKCEEIGKASWEVIKINQNLRQHEKLQDQELLAAKQEVKLIEHKHN